MTSPSLFDKAIETDDRLRARAVPQTTTGMLDELSDHDVRQLAASVVNDARKEVGLFSLDSPRPETRLLLCGAITDELERRHIVVAEVEFRPGALQAWRLANTSIIRVIDTPES